jgi:hypothetical protein
MRKHPRFEDIASGLVVKCSELYITKPTPFKTDVKPGEHASERIEKVIAFYSMHGAVRQQSSDDPRCNAVMVTGSKSVYPYCMINEPSYPAIEYEKWLALTEKYKALFTATSMNII